MSDSITKYYELVEKETASLQSEHQRSVKTIVEILQASKKSKTKRYFIETSSKGISGRTTSYPGYGIPNSGRYC
jgi:hypothetical protein